MMNDRIFSWPVRVYYEDTDTGGIVYHANYLKFFERARTEFLRALGWHQQQMLEDQTFAFVVSRMDIQFKRPAKLDDELVITTEVVNLRHASVTLRQKAFRDNTLLSSADVVIVSIDPQRLSPMAMPETLYKQMIAYKA